MAEVVRQAQVLKSIVAALKSEFGCPVYSDEVREDFKKPCFFIAASSTMSPQTVAWMRKELTIRLTYYGKDSEKNEIAYMNVIDRVQALFPVGIQVKDRNLKIGTIEDDRVGEEDDILAITITIPYLEKIDAVKSSELMEEIDMNVIHNGGRGMEEEFPDKINKDSI